MIDINNPETIRIKKLTIKLLRTILLIKVIELIIYKILLLLVAFTMTITTVIFSIPAFFEEGSAKG